MYRSMCMTKQQLNKLKQLRDELYVLCREGRIKELPKVSKQFNKLFTEAEEQDTGE